MANYRIGKNRIYYQPSNFQSAIIEAYFYSPKGIKSDTYSFIELEDGIYYSDVFFDDLGDYLGVFFEDGEKKSSLVFKVDEKRFSLFWEGEPLM